MAVEKDGKRYEYNIDGDLVPEGSVTPNNMYGDFENRYEPKSGNANTDSDWGKSVDALFSVIDPTESEATDKECQEAVDTFLGEIS